MYIHFVKLIHLLLTLGLLGSTIYCVTLISAQKLAPAALNANNRIARLNKILLLQVFFVVLTGTVLVYPKHFTFHTPWIQAAYLLVFLFSISVFGLIYFNKKIKQRWIWYVVYFFLIIVLISIIHDAVTKTTFLPNSFL